MISLDSEFEDSPGPVLADIGLDSGSSVADIAEASTGITQPSFGMLRAKSQSSFWLVSFINSGCCFSFRG